jgi:hypothetical protein
MVHRNREQWAKGGPRLMYAIEGPGALIGVAEANDAYSNFVGYERGERMSRTLLKFGDGPIAF